MARHIFEQASRVLKRFHTCVPQINKVVVQDFFVHDFEQQQGARGNPPCSRICFPSCPKDLRVVGDGNLLLPRHQQREAGFSFMSPLPTNKCLVGSPSVAHRTKGGGSSPARADHLPPNSLEGFETLFVPLQTKGGTP